MFKDPKDEEKVCQVLKSYVEECGPEAVTVKLPAKWYSPEYTLGPTHLEFTTVDSIEIVAMLKDAIAYEYKLEITVD